MKKSKTRLRRYAKHCGQVKNQKKSPEIGLHSLLLIFLKETYFFLKNFYGLIVHPYKNTREIVSKPDRSQIILVFGLPIYLWFFGALVFLPPFWLIRNWYNARILSLLLFYFFTLSLFFLACFLVFRLYQYFQKCK